MNFNCLNCFRLGRNSTINPIPQQDTGSGDRAIRHHVPMATLQQIAVVGVGQARNYTPRPQVYTVMNLSISSSGTGSIPQPPASALLEEQHHLETEHPNVYHLYKDGFRLLKAIVKDKLGPSANYLQEREYLRISSSLFVSRDVSIWHNISDAIKEAESTSDMMKSPYVEPFAREVALLCDQALTYYQMKTNMLPSIVENQLEAIRKLKSQAEKLASLTAS